MISFQQFPVIPGKYRIQPFFHTGFRLYAPSSNLYRLQKYLKDQQKDCQKKTGEYRYTS